jgi:hypothetical protein
METQTVHFTIDADFINEHARNLWSEGEYRKAKDFLSTLIGITEKQMNAISLVKDNWKPNLDRCHLSQYPNPDNPDEMKKAESKLKDLEFEKTKSSLISRMLDKAEENRQELQKIKNILSRLDASNDTVEFLDNCRDYLSGKYMDDTDRVLLELDKFIENQKFVTLLENSGEKPKPTKEIYENGIITPDGSFYRCEFAAHTILAEKLGYEGDPPFTPDDIAVKSGCIVLTANLLLRKARYKPELRGERQIEKFKQWFNLTFSSDIPFFHVKE